MLDKFTVIDLVQTRSASVVNISGNYIKFNNQTAAELGYPPFVQFLYLEKKQQFGIRACKEDASNAVPFSKPTDKQKGPIRISLPAVTSLIRRMAGWEADQAWNIPGIYFAEDNGLVYDVRTAFPPAHRASRKKAEPIEDEED